MQLEPGMRLLTESDGRVELAEAGNERPEPAQPEAALPAGADAELASLQEAIRQGQTRPNCLERRRRAAGAGTTGGVVGSSAGGFVVVDLNSDTTWPRRGLTPAMRRVSRATSCSMPKIGSAGSHHHHRTPDRRQHHQCRRGDRRHHSRLCRGCGSRPDRHRHPDRPGWQSPDHHHSGAARLRLGGKLRRRHRQAGGRPPTIQADTQDAAGNRASDTGQTLLDTITTITLDLADESDTGTSQTDDLTRDTTPLLLGRGAWRPLP